MSHIIEKRWPELSSQVSSEAQGHLNDTVRRKELFDSVKAVYAYCGHDDAVFATLLFHGDKDLLDVETGLVPLASADEVTMAKDLFDAAKVWDHHHDFMNNVIVTDINRVADLRNIA